MYKKEFDQIYQGNSAPAIALFDRLSAEELNALAKTDSPYKGDRLVHAAARMNDVKLLNQCIKARLNLNPHKAEDHDSIDGSPLLLAAQQFQVDCLQMLLRHLKDEEIQDKFNALTLGKMVSLYKDKSQRDKALLCIAELLATGFNPNSRIHNCTPISLALECADEDLVVLLLRHGADPTIPSEEFNNLPAVVKAITKNQTAIVRAMFEHANINPNMIIKLKEEHYPLLYFAAINSNIELFTLIKEKGANLHQKVLLHKAISMPMAIAIQLHDKNNSHDFRLDPQQPLAAILQQFIDAGIIPADLKIEEIDVTENSSEAEDDIHFNPNIM